MMARDLNFSSVLMSTDLKEDFPDQIYHQQFLMSINLKVDIPDQI